MGWGLSVLCCLSCSPAPIQLLCYPHPSFLNGCLFSLQTLFGNKPAGFGATTTSAPSFGTTTGGGLFGNKPELSANPSFLPVWGQGKTCGFHPLNLCCVNHTLQRAGAECCSVGIEVCWVVPVCLVGLPDTGWSSATVLVSP